MSRRLCPPCAMSSHGTVLSVHHSCFCACHPPERFNDRGQIIRPADPSRTVAAAKKPRPLVPLPTGQLRSPSTRNQIVRLLERDGDRCHWCNVQFSATVAPTREHVVPRSKPGSSNLDENMVLACSPCNNDRGDLDYEVYRLQRLQNGRIDFDNALAA